MRYQHWQSRDRIVAFVYFAGNIIVVNLLLLHLILATILKSFYRNRDEEISKDNVRKALGNRAFVFEKLARDDDQDDGDAPIDTFSKSALSGFASDEETPDGDELKRKVNKRGSEVHLGDNSEFNKSPQLFGSNRSIKRFEDKIALKADESETGKQSDLRGNTEGNSREILFSKGRLNGKRLTLYGNIDKKSNSVYPKAELDKHDGDLFDRVGINRICEMRESYVRSKQSTFSEVYLKYETKKINKKVSKKEIKSSEEMFNFKAFEKCYMILNVRTFLQKLIFSMVYWWPVVVIEHIMIIINCVYLCTYNLKSDMRSKYVISWMNLCLILYLLVISSLRILLIKRASKSIKREYFLFLDMAIGVLGGIELITGYFNNNYELMPASVTMFLIVRVLMKAYSTSISTSLKELISHANKTMKEIRYFLMILLVIILFFTFVGMSLYGQDSLPAETFQRNRYLRLANFSGFWRGILTVFMVLTLESWVVTFLEYRQKFGAKFVTVYFVCLTLVVAIVMFKFFLSLIINNFLETSKKMEKMKRYKETTSKQDLTVDEQIYSNIY
jgi:Ion transport protein